MVKFGEWMDETDRDELRRALVSITVPETFPSGI
jgi:hypothetical protein